MVMGLLSTKVVTIFWEDIPCKNYLLGYMVV